MGIISFIISAPVKRRMCEYDYKHPATQNYNLAHLCDLHLALVQAKQEAAHARNNK